MILGDSTSVIGSLASSQGEAQEPHGASQIAVPQGSKLLKNGLYWEYMREYDRGVQEWQKVLGDCMGAILPKTNMSTRQRSSPWRGSRNFQNTYEPQRRSVEIN